MVLHFGILLGVHDGSERDTKVGCGAPEVCMEMYMLALGETGRWHGCDGRAQHITPFRDLSRGAMPGGVLEGESTHGSSRGSR